MINSQTWRVRYLRMKYQCCANVMAHAVLTSVLFAAYPISSSLISVSYSNNTLKYQYVICLPASGWEVDTPYGVCMV